MNLLGHRFASPKPDGADPTQIQPSHWNDGHRFTGGAAGDVLTRDPTDATYGAVWKTPSTGWQSITAAGAVTLPTDRLTHFVSVNSATAIDLQGAAPLSGSFQVGTRLDVMNTGAGIVTLVQQSPSVAVGKFANLITSGNVTRMNQFGSAAYVWDGANWRLIQHEQRLAIQFGFTNANFIGFTCSNIGMQDYYVHGREAHIRCYFAPAVVAAPLTVLKITGWPWTFNPQTLNQLQVVSSYVAAHAPWGIAFGAVGTAGTTIDINPQDFITWPAGSYYLSFDIWLPLT